jgi:hypothetical protein
MTTINSVNFSDIFIRQSQNTARLGFEVRFRAVKRRLDLELNAKKEVYNNIDKTLEPVLAGLKRERAAVEKQRTDLTNYLEVARRNVNKLGDIITKQVTDLSDAASAVGGTAEADFNLMRDQVNKALKNLQSNSYFEGGFYDKTTKFKSQSNPSGIGDYSSYASVVDRASAVGVFVSTSADGIETNTALSRGLGETLGVLRYNLVQDFDLAKAKQEQATQKLKDIDKQIEKKDAEERLVFLKEIQALEKKNERTLENLSLNFEFSQANTETFADRTSFLKPQKGSIMNLFI